MGCKIGNSLTECAVNLSTIKLETSKVNYFVERVLLLYTGVCLDVEECFLATS